MLILGGKSMKLTIESTTKIVTLNGVPSRVWEGHTESGTPVIVFIARVMVADGHTAEFDAALEACKAPSPDVQAIPVRLIL